MDSGLVIGYLWDVMNELETNNTSRGSGIWTALRVLVIVFFVISFATGALIPSASWFARSGHPVVAKLVFGYSFSFFVGGLIVLLPRTANLSEWKWMRVLGRVPTVVRFLGLLIVSVSVMLLMKLLSGL